MPYANDPGVIPPPPAPAPAAPAGAAPSFPGSVAGALSDPNYLSQIAGYLGGQAAPGIAQGNLSEAQALAGLGVLPAQVDLGAANLENQTGYSLANALLGEQGIGLQGQSLAAQYGAGQQQQGLEQQQFGVGEQQRQAAAALLGTQEKIYGQEVPIQAEQLAASQAGSGTGNTVGAGQARTLQGLGVQQQEAQFGYQGTNQYLSEQLAQLGQQSEQVGYGLSQEQLQNAQQQLGLSAQGQGLSAQQAISQLQYGLGQLGIAADPTQLLAAAAGGQSTAASGYAGLLSQAGAITGLGPNFGLGG